MDIAADAFVDGDHGTPHSPRRVECRKLRHDGAVVDARADGGGARSRDVGAVGEWALAQGASVNLRIFVRIGASARAADIAEQYFTVSRP